jgi:hypothetical protein
VPFIECEYVNKIKQVLEKGAWEEYTGDYNNQSPPYAIRLAFRAFLTALISDDESYIRTWTNNLNKEIAKLFTVNQLHFNLSAKTIQPLFKCANEDTFYFERGLNLIKSLKQECLLKSSFVTDEKRTKINEIRNKLEKTETYLSQFNKEEPKGQISFSNYLDTRGNKYPDLSKKLLTKDNYGQNVIIREVLMKTEKQELAEAFGGPQLSF